MDVRKGKQNSIGNGWVAVGIEGPKQVVMSVEGGLTKADKLLQNLPDIWMKMFSALHELSPETSFGHVIMFVWMSDEATKLHWVWMGGSWH